MPFYSINYKLNWLQKHYDNTTIENIEEGLDITFDSFDSLKNQFAKRRILKLDLIYCFLRNNRWLDVKIFAEIVSDYISCEYKLSNDESFLVISICKGLVEKNTLVTNATYTFVAVNDFNYLKYIFCTLLSPIPYEEVVADLGIGSNLLEALQQSVGILTSKQTTYFYSNEIFEYFNEIINEFSSESKDTPWVNDVYRIKLTLPKFSDFWDPLIEKTDLSWLLDFLSDLGKSTPLNAKQIREKLESTLSRKLDKDKVNELIEQLVNSSMVHKLYSDVQSRWELSPDGFNITAKYFTSMGKKKELNVQEISKLNSYWQLETVLNIDNKKSATLLENLNNQPLHPSTISALFDKSKSEIPREKMQKVLSTLVSKGATKKIRHVSQECLKKLESHNDGANLSGR